MEEHLSKLEKFDSELWHYHFKVPAEIAEPFLGENERRVICTVNGILKFHCALMHDGKGDFFINLNKENRKSLGLDLGDEFKYSLAPDESKYGMPLPEEMEELLKMDDEASKWFHALTLGKQRSLLFIIGKPKTSATRLNKAIAIAEFLKMNKGVLDFKLLNSFMKDFNKI